MQTARSSTGMAPWALLLALCISMFLPFRHVSAADATNVEAPAEGMVTLTFPPNVELKVLIEYISQRLKLNILYDDRVANQRITIKAPREIAADSLLGVLESTLAMKGLVLVDAEQEGWKQIVPANNLQAISQQAVAADDNQRRRPGDVLTQIYMMQHADPRKVDPVIKPFLTQPGGNSIALPDQRMLIVTDFAANMKRIQQLIQFADQPPSEVQMQFVKVQHLDATQLASQVTQLLSAKTRVQSGDAPTLKLDISADTRTNQLIIIGSPARVQEAIEVAASLDVPLGLTTQVYQFQVASPQRVDRLARELLSPIDATRLYRSSIDNEANLLIVSTTAEVHARIAKIKSELDIALPESQNPVRFYKLMNASATEVLATIRQVEGNEGMAHIADARPASDKQAAEPTTDKRLETARPTRPSGPNQPPAEAGEAPPLPPMQELQQDSSPLNNLRPTDTRAVRTKRATVVADINTNSIIVVAEPAVQQIYQRLIETLDQRRPQVLIETTIVTLDTSDGFSLGVEISRSGSFTIGDNEADTLTFSSFGLSEVDPDTGRLSLTPGLGFNGAIISADIADVVVRALSTSGRAKVVSAPKVLVNDNATGTINSINESPFTSVNASDTVATTSFAGFVSAGTEITVTPHIAEGDHLRLEFEITLNSFTGDSSDGIPPPRQTNSVSSEITVPDGNTIIVGGINRTDSSETVSSIPLLGQIPLLKYLFSSRDTNDQSSTLFVFIRPVILRDDQFQDLKYLSSRDMDNAELPADYPSSEPMLIR